MAEDGRPAEVPLILVSNRGPVGFGRGADGARTMDRSGGGLVTALWGLVAHSPALWIAAAIGDEDARVAEEAGGGEFALPGVGMDTRGRFVRIDPDTYHKYYNVIANPMLWFIQHYLWDLSNAPDIRREELDAWEHGYLVANRRFADEISAALEDHPGAVVMMHDYHLYTAPAVVRERHPGVFLHFFVHIPWAQPDTWRVLPQHIREAVASGLLACDIVAFHTRRYARNFLMTCEDLLDLRVDYEAMTVNWRGRDVLVRHYPISVNAERFEELARSREVAEEEGPILRRRRRHLIVRVDRTDLSKNILRGFKAFDTFLDRHPEFLEQITFFAMLQPSRQDVDEYVEYVAKIRDLVSHINTKHGNTDWMPIDLRFESNLAKAVAAYKHYDVMMVNSIFDGMNLVAKEAALVNERDGVLILSKNIGAYEEIGHFALGVNPFDIEIQARALYEALNMPRDERRDRARHIREIIRENDVAKWLDHQMRDIAEVREARAAAPAKAPKGRRRATRRAGSAPGT
ncbi:MAG: trehalose-6-phosphate synthase [Thermoleophilia bacterium]|jgi:trehalose 6-phosphate synthase|nr:trehalose-6-phosphate synthase [Thermoleophilia bacterium]